MRTINNAFGSGEHTHNVSSLCALLLPSGPLFLADAFLNIDPTAEEIVAITRASIDQVKHFGITPKVALLSHSNFGTSNAASAKKMRDAAEILRAENPEYELDGEMHALTAMTESLRQTI